MRWPWCPASDPPVLLLDEPINGLDTEGIRWVRGLLRGMAAEGRTVLVSSHVMSEMELTADHLVVIGRGRLIADCPIGEFLQRSAAPQVVVRTPSLGRLTSVLVERGATVIPAGPDSCRVSGLDAAEVGTIASAHGVTLHELSPRRSSLEEVYTQLTEPESEYVTGDAA